MWVDNACLGLLCPVLTGRSMTPRELYVLMVELLLSPLLYPFRFAKLWYHRIRIRRAARAMNLRRLRKTVNVLAVLVAGTLVPHSGTAQQPADSLIGTVLSRNVIPAAWQPGQLGIYCLTWVAEREDRPRLLVIIDATIANPNLDPLCPDGRGGFYPLWVDGPICPPGQVSPFTDRDFVIVRCSNDSISRYKRPMPVLKRS